MNERIKQLLGQAYDEAVPETWTTLSSEQLDRIYEKFAELIVRECVERASIGNGHGNNQWDRALTFAGKNIKEHFGLEL